MGRVLAEIQVANNRDVQAVELGVLPRDQVRRARLPGVVDSGATDLVLPETVVRQLGLPAAGQTIVRYADGRRDKRDRVEQARVTLAGRESTFDAIVEPNRTDALVGAIVLEALDLLVDCRNQTVVPRDPNSITAEIE